MCKYKKHIPLSRHTSSKLSSTIWENNFQLRSELENEYVRRVSEIQLADSEKLRLALAEEAAKLDLMRKEMNAQMNTELDKVYPRKLHESNFD
jgi:hypothetical protein